MFEQITSKATELALPEFLKWLITSGILAKLGKDQIKKVYGLIRNKHNEGKYAFFPNKDEVETLKKLFNKSIYKDFKEILKNHWGVDVVRTGIYILTLEQKGEIERIKEIKDQVFKNKKLPGLRLIEMITMGIMRVILDHLKTLKEKYNYSSEDLNNEFEDLLHTWKKITIFVKNDDSLETIEKQAKDMIYRKEETFFVFAKGQAISTACSLIVKLQKDKFLLEKGYVWFAETDASTIPSSYYCGIHSSTYLI